MGRLSGLASLSSSVELFLASSPFLYRLHDATLTLSQRFGAIREQDERQMTALKFPSEAGPPLAHTLLQVRAGKQRVCFGKREEEEILGLVEPSGLDCCLSDRPEESACLGKEQPDDKTRHL